MSVEFWLTPSADYPYENPIRGRDITSATRYWTLTQDMSEQRSTVVLGLIRSLVPDITLGDIVEVINWPVWSDHAFSGIVTEIGAVKKGLVEVTVSGRDSLLANMRMDPFTGQMSDRDILHRLGLAMGFPSSSDPYYLDYIHESKNYTWNSYRMTDRTGLDCLGDLNGTQLTVGDPLTYAYVCMTWDSGKVDGKPATHVVGKVHRRQDNHVSLPKFVQWRYTPTGGDIIGEPEYREDTNAIVNSVTVVGDKVSATAEEAASIAKYGRRPRTYYAPWIVSQADAEVKAARLVSRLSILDTRVTVSRPRSSAHPWPPEYMYWAEFDDQINGRYIYGRIIGVEFDSRKPTIRYTIGSPAMSSMSGSLFALSNELIGIKSGLDQSLKTTDAPVFAGLTLDGDLLTTGKLDGVDLSTFKSDYDGKINQGLKTTHAPTFAGATVGGVEIIGGTVDGVDVSTHNHDGSAVGGAKISSATGVEFKILQNQARIDGTTPDNGLAISPGANSPSAIVLQTGKLRPGVAEKMDIGGPDTVHHFKDAYLSGNVKAGTFNGATINATKTAEWDTAVKRAYPVGSIYLSTAPTNPATLFGFGTWVPFGQGRVLLGVGDGYTVGSTGGAKTVTLTEAQIPTHKHNVVVNAGGLHGHTIRGGTGSGSRKYVKSESWFATFEDVSVMFGGEHSHSVTESSIGSGSAHENMPPYITVYMWNRTA